MNVYAVIDKGHLVFIVAPDRDNAQTMVDASLQLRYIGAVPGDDAEQGIYPHCSGWFQNKGG